MPKGPKGEKRPADVVSNAVHVMRIATREIEEKTPDSSKDPAAVALGRRGGLKGGRARAESLSKEKRSAIARQAAKKRWRAD